MRARAFAVGRLGRARPAQALTRAVARTRVCAGAGLPGQAAGAGAGAGASRPLSSGPARATADSEAAGGAPEQELPSHIRGRVDAAVPDDVVDLSTVGRPMGALFDAMPASRAEWMAHALSPEQLAAYDRDGYITNVPVLSEAQCDALLEDYVSFCDPEAPHRAHGLFHEFHWNQSGDPSNVLLHALGQWRITPRFHDLVWLPAVTMAAHQLMSMAMSNGGPGRGKERPVGVRFWHDQLFAKPGPHGGGVAYHQDYSYWQRTAPMNHLTVHIALDDQTLENGALHYVPGSHTWTREGAPLPITSDDFSDMDSVKDVLSPEELAAFKPTPSLLRKGEASFHHALAMHGSYGNRSAGPRRAAVLNYMADGTSSVTNEELLLGVPVVPAGSTMAGRFFPLVFDPACLQA